CRSPRILGKVRGDFFQKDDFLPELSEFILLLAEPGSIAHGQRRLVTRVLAAVGINPIAESRLMNTELFGDLGDRTRRLDHSLNGLFLELGREPHTFLCQPYSFRTTPILVGPTVRKVRGTSVGLAREDAGGLV